MNELGEIMKCSARVQEGHPSRSLLRFWLAVFVFVLPSMAHDG